jgi:thioredoxin-related protein
MAYLKFSFILSILVLFSSEIKSQDKIHWLTWDQAKIKSSVQKKKIFIDVYTDWCGWCKKMDRTTFEDSSIANIINENYYAIKFDAETKDPITINDVEYNFVKNGKRGYHELAAQLLRGKMSYPSVVFLNEEFELIQPIPGYQTIENLEMIASYFAGNFHESTPWRKYTQEYQSRNQTPHAIPVGN